jgi:aldose 1-epimerase
MRIASKVFGQTKEGQAVKSYVLSNENGIEVEVLDYGAVIRRLCVPDRGGKTADIVLGYDSVAGYENTTVALGGFIGRNANRIGNGRFVLNNRDYELEKNDNGKNNLHSGLVGYHKMMYQVRTRESMSEAVVTFFRTSPDKEQGFPGELKVAVSYTLTDKDELRIEYLAEAKEDTIVNLTNHSYFNLAGHDSGSVLDQRVTIFSEAFTPADEAMIPTGEIVAVDGTPMDFRKGKAIGQDIGADYEPLLLAGGYDHNYILKTKKGELTLAAKAEDTLSGRGMTVYTDRPGLQFYTGNFLEGETGGKEGAVYEKHGGFCFETQAYPDAPNKPAFPTTIVKAGESFSSATVFSFYLVP